MYMVSYINNFYLSPIYSHERLAAAQEQYNERRKIDNWEEGGSY